MVANPPAWRTFYESEESVHIAVAAGFLAALIINRPAATMATGSLTELEIAAIVFGWHFSLVIGLYAIWCFLKRWLLPRCNPQWLPVCRWVKNRLIPASSRRLRRAWNRFRSRLGIRGKRPSLSALERLQATIQRTASWKLQLALVTICVLPEGPIAAMVVLRQRHWSILSTAALLGVYGWISFTAYRLVVGLMVQAIAPPPEAVIGLLTLVAIPLVVELLGIIARAYLRGLHHQVDDLKIALTSSPPPN